MITIQLEWWMVFLWLAMVILGGVGLGTLAGFVVRAVLRRMERKP
jgi:NhaP-type Na+/H+ or K+/H+ antiporter